MKATCRSIRYWSEISIKGCIRFLAFLVGLICIMKIANPYADLFAIRNFIGIYGSIYCCIMCYGMVMSYMPIALTYSITRKKTFVGYNTGNICNILLIAIASFILICLVDGKINLWQFVLIFCMCAAGSGLGTICSSIMARMGGGMLWYMFTVMIAAAVGGVCSGFILLDTSDKVLLGIKAVMCVVGIIIYLIGMVVSNAVIEKMDIRV